MPNTEVCMQKSSEHCDSQLSKSPQACRGRVLETKILSVTWTGGALAVPHGSTWGSHPGSSRPPSPAVELGPAASHRLALHLGHPTRPESGSQKTLCSEVRSLWRPRPQGIETASFKPGGRERMLGFFPATGCPTCGENNSRNNLEIFNRFQ